MPTYAITTPAHTTPTHEVLLQLVSAGIRLGARNFGPFGLQIKTGERVAILGPSGAGKSTLLKLMAREWAATTGEVLFKGRSLAKWSLSDLSRSRAVLPQNHQVAFGLNTDLVVGLGRVAHEHDPQLPDIVDASLKQARADHLLGRRFDTLSGGEQARVQLARIFAQLWDVRDGLILVDEPLSALDPGLQFEVLSSLESYAAARHHAVVAILHDLNQAMQDFDRLLLVKDGALIGDLPSSIEAIPALESLYDISLCCLTAADGSWIVAPSRKTTRRALLEKVRVQA